MKRRSVRPAEQNSGHRLSGDGQKSLEIGTSPERLPWESD
jgi:hypothetical protein